MAEPNFEHQVARLFAEAPSFPDQRDFTYAVQARLERGWGVRRLLIGAAGAAGGLVAAVQVFQANLVQRAAAASRDADLRAHDLAERGAALLHLHVSLGGEVVWMVAGLGAVGLALAAARLADRF
jgi:hypothetical protein